MLWMCNNKTEEKWIVSFCSCSLRYHISTFPDDKKSLWDHQCLLPHRHSSGWGCERQWSTEKGAEVLWCCLSFISHCSNFLWMNIWWSLRLEPTFANSFVINQLSGGFKFWVLADSTGFTSDCSLYCGKQHGRPICENGLAFDVVTDIFHTYDYQGYSVYFANCYTLLTLLHASKEKISATGTLCTNRRGIPSSVLEMKVALSRADVPRGTGYYIRDYDDVYVYWRDNDCVCIMSNEHPGHSEGMARRAAKTSTGAYQPADVSFLQL